MKILKVELQNINSLKSDSPVAINFEDEKFKDVGLYAITGSTGAGKTTILDAITIALYHSVPRFNDTKGSIIDSVSHGAHDAFSRVTFENDNVIYEAYWGIRVADKKGKKYKNAKEEVSLKNLSTGAILANQKRDLLKKVIDVTQLDYNQFLRSVMLAQGEFASFLSAKGPEKGKLLEQITGEEIYKKIGQGILDRKSNEDNKLREIQSKINSDDELNEEAKIELSQRDTVLETEITRIKEEMETVRLIVEWYTKFQDLINESEKLDQNSSEIDILNEKHKAEFALLDLNAKAEPFKELIQNFKRTEKNSIEHSKQLKTIEDGLLQLKPDIEDLEKLAKNQSAELETADKEFANWLPKFDLITTLDGQLKNESEKKLQAQNLLDALIQQIEALKIEEKKLAQELSDTESKIKSDEAFVSQNKFLLEVDAERSNWTRELTTLKTTKETLNQNSLFISQKNKEVEKTSQELAENTKLLTKKTAEIEAAEKEISELSEQLSKNSLSDLIAKKEKLALLESNWKQFQGYSERTLKAEKEQIFLLDQQKTCNADLESTQKQIEAIIKQIEIQDKLVAKADKVLELEKRISKYENDRQHLKKGEPCSLCGSKEHPFVDYLAPYNVSKSELELRHAKDELNTLVNSKNELDKKDVKLNTSITNLTPQINSISEEIKAIKSSASLLNIVCELSNTAKINSELDLAAEQIKLANENIKVAQQIQTNKNNLSESIKTQNESLHSLKTETARLSENIKNSKSEIEGKEQSTENLSILCTDLERELKTKLAEFNYELPSFEHTDSFIQKIEKTIAYFNEKQKDLDSLKATIKVINNNIDNTKKQLDTYHKAQTDYLKTIRECDVKSERLITERSEILPLTNTVESKRESLQSARNLFAEKVERSKKGLQQLLDSKTEKETLKVKYTKEQKELINEFSSLKSELDSQIKSSGFESKQDLESALLTKEDKEKYTQNKEGINEKKSKTKTLKESNTKAKEILTKSKNFEISEADSKSALEDLSIKYKVVLTEKGTIIEAFRKDQEIRDRNKEIYKKIDAQAEICSVWKELFKIIGNSKDAFNVYVQRLTLKHLLDLANVHLYKLNKRYSLKMEEAYKPKEELNFNLIDHYQTDQARLVDTSSGGEKFIISLALALGLSDLASKNVKIDSLFIDEGFGTLDSNTLETVISTLETLQSQGKMIGIISHVENLKERIPTQIQITKKSNGVSVVEII